MSPFKTLSASVALGVLALASTGCAPAADHYRPMSASHPSRGGYSEVRLGDGRYEVTFVGNTLTSREQVEAYLLYRSAELTLEQGYDWFVIEDREVEHKVERESHYNPWFAQDYGYWRPYWRYYGPGIGWNTWYPYGGDPFWADRYDSRKIERFEVKADIRMGRSPVPVAGPRTFDAREVLARLGPTVRPPKS